MVRLIHTINFEFFLGMIIIPDAATIVFFLLLSNVCFAATEPVLTVLGSDTALNLPDGVARIERPAALSFSAAPLSLDAVRAAEWLPKTAITVEAWVRVNEPARWTGFAGCLQDNGNFERGWVLGCHTTGFYFGISANAKKRFTYLNATTPLVPGKWYQVVGTYNGSVQRIYVDGKLAGESKAQSGDIIYPQRLLPVIGGYFDDNDNIILKGDLESLRVWGVALSAEQIGERFGARKSRFPGIERTADDTMHDLNWPTYRRDNQRSGTYPRDLKLPLFPTWIHYAQNPPKPAWPGTAQTDFWRKRSTPEESLVEFDKAYDVVASGNRVVYGTSADDKVVCLDLETGKTLWQAFAEGPIRLAPTISAERVVFGSDDGYIYCLDLSDGKRLWRQSAVEDQGQRRPGNGRIIGKYPVRSGVIVRGAVVYYAAGLFPRQGAWHGAMALADGSRLDGKSLNASPQGYLREQSGQLFVPTGRHPSGAFLKHLKRRGKIESKQAAAISNKYPYAFIATPSYRFAGGTGEIAVMDASTGETVETAPVKGRVLSLAIAGDTLLACTDQGAIHAFQTTRRRTVAKITFPKPSKPQPTSAAKFAKNVLSKCGRHRGYALVVGDAAGDFTKELALQSQLQVVGIGLTQADASRQREHLANANLYGRAVIHDVPADQPPYLERIFNLVVLSPQRQDEGHGRWLKLLRPGGLLVHGSTTQRAPAIAGSGSWSHLYGDAGNTACSRDSVSTANLELQWFGAPGPQHIIDRHLRGMGPLARDGYLFVPGNDYLYGVDSFNGTVLWEKPIKSFRRIGVLRGSGSLAVGESFLYAAAGEHCLVLNRTTGKEIRRFHLPRHDNPREWGYLAVHGRTVIGSAVKRGGVYRTFARDAIYAAGYGDNTKITVSNELFAYDTQTGKRLWTYQPKGAIFDPAVGVNQSHVVFLESGDKETLLGPPRSHYPQLLDTEGGDLVAVDRNTGAEVWRHDFNGPEGIQTLFLSCTDGEVVVCFSRNSLAEGAESETVHYEARVYEPYGELRWQQSFNTGKRPNLDHGEQDRHPAIVGKRLVVEPYIYDLADGKTLETFSRGFGCGTISASADDLFFRSGNPASYSLTTKQLTPLNSVSRPGCWINIITSDGLVLIPEASSGCICKYPIQCTMVFVPN